MICMKKSYLSPDQNLRKRCQHLQVDSNDPLQTQTLLLQKQPNWCFSNNWTVTKVPTSLVVSTPLVTYVILYLSHHSFSFFWPVLYISFTYTCIFCFICSSFSVCARFFSNCASYQCYVGIKEWYLRYACGTKIYLPSWALMKTCAITFTTTWKILPTLDCP